MMSRYKLNIELPAIYKEDYKECVGHRRIHLKMYYSTTRAAYYNFLFNNFLQELKKLK